MKNYIFNHTECSSRLCQILCDTDDKVLAGHLFESSLKYVQLANQSADNHDYAKGIAMAVELVMMPHQRQLR